MTATIHQIPFAAYRALPGTNSSALSDLRVSPLLYQYRHPDVCGSCGHDCMGKPALDEWRRLCPACQGPLAGRPRPDTAAMKLGRAMHSIIIEPDTTILEYTVYRDSKTKGEGSRTRWHEFRDAATAEGKTVLDVADYDTCLVARRAVYRNADAIPLVAAATHRELSITWTHRSGERMKSRIDMLTPTHIVDMKSTRDISRWRFGADAKKFGYHVQAAVYQDAVEAAFGRRLPYLIMAPQNCEPFDVAVFSLPDEAIQRGRDSYEEGIATLQRCRAGRRWPGMYSGVQELEIRGDYDEDDLICDDAPGDDV